MTRQPSSAAVATSGPSPALEAEAVRRQFPILHRQVHGKPLVYLDNAASTQRPLAVLEALDRYYRHHHANVHRAVHVLSQEATQLYEDARRRVQRFLNAASERQIIFTRGATESINLVAASYGRKFIKAGDEILLTAMEHHSNIVPWQLLCEQTGAVLKVVPFAENGELRLEEYQRMLGPRTKMVAVVHLSNSLGTINPVKRMIAMAHEHGAVALIDGAQWVAHGPTDVRDLDCDFYVFSGHKLYGPTGIGVLYGRQSLLEAMPPYQGGGDMISSVTFERTTYNDLPYKFEAGTPHIAGAVGLGAAIDYVSSIGAAAIAAHEQDLLKYATRRLEEVPGLRIVGTAAHKGSVISFVLEDPPVATHDIGVLLDMEGVAIRTGHHCCQPALQRLGLSSTARISLAMYNTRQDIDIAVEALKKVSASARPRPPAEAAIEYPQAYAPSPSAAADKLAEVFEFLGDDANAKSLYLMEDLGSKLPNLFDVLKKMTPRLEGCMSEVYLVGRRSPRDPQVLEFVADANAAIVRGEIVMLQRLFSGQKAREVLAFDVEEFFRRIGLEQFLSSQRRSGLASMVNRIRQLAREIAGPPGAAEANR